MHDQAGTVIGGSHDSSSPYTPRSINEEINGSWSRMSSNRIRGAAQSRPMIMTRRAGDMGNGILGSGRRGCIEQSAGRRRPPGDQLAVDQLEGRAALGHTLGDHGRVAVAVCSPEIGVAQKLDQR